MRIQVKCTSKHEKAKGKKLRLLDGMLLTKDRFKPKTLQQSPCGKWYSHQIWLTNNNCVDRTINDNETSKSCCGINNESDGNYWEVDLDGLCVIDKV